MPVDLKLVIGNKNYSSWSRRPWVRFGGPGDLLFGHFTIADAYYAPVAMRFITYGPPLSSAAQRYVDIVRSLPAVTAWVSAALSETELAADEPYAERP